MRVLAISSCSADGLNILLTDDEIGAWLAADASLQEICSGLVNDANTTAVSIT